MSDLLLDTHTMLWFFWDDPKLSIPAKELIENKQHRKLISIASCWEIAIKVSLRKLDLGEPPKEFLQRQMALNFFELLPISFAHATTVGLLAMFHRDPFDRLLVAQSMWENIPIVSADAIFDGYPVQRLW